MWLIKVGSVIANYRTTEPVGPFATAGQLLSD
jgi:hypothetical protein